MNIMTKDATLMNSAFFRFLTVCVCYAAATKTIIAKARLNKCIQVIIEWKGFCFFCRIFFACLSQHIHSTFLLKKKQQKLSTEAAAEDPRQCNKSNDEREFIEKLRAELIWQHKQSTLLATTANISWNIKDWKFY